MRRLIILAAVGLLAACKTAPAVELAPINVVVPVSAPCVRGTRPGEVTPVNKTMTRKQWNVLTTDQREKLLGGNSLDRKAYGDKLYVATAGCP